MNYLKLKQKIYEAIERNPLDRSAYEEMFAVCREYEKIDFQTAHAWNHELRNHISWGLRMTVSCQKFDEAREFDDLMFRSLLFGAQHFFLSLLINAYRKGVQAASEMLAYDLTVDVRSMDEVIYLVIDGKTFEDRVADHVLSGDLQGLQTLAESEFHRVYNAAVLDGGHQYQSSVGYGVTKNWYTVMDDKVRETHRYLEGASVSLDEEFWTFDGDHAAYPGGFTKAENNVNCRCTVELHIDAEEE